MQVYLNGQMIDHAHAQISVDDAGFQHAVGLFETMGVYHGHVFRLQAHIDRLTQSAAELGLTRPDDLVSLQHAVETTVQQNRLENARLRLTVTAGSASLLTSGHPEPPSPTVLVVATPPTQYDDAYFEQGIMVAIAPPAANPFDATAGHKTLAYWQRLRTLRQAAAIGAGEAIWLNATNHLASGAVSNLFLVKDNQLFTPFARGEEAQGALPAPVLPGITRATVIELAQAMGIPVARQMLTVPDLLEADEVFLTNSSWLVLPVTRVEKTEVAAGTVGATTSKLRIALHELIEQEIGGT